MEFLAEYGLFLAKAVTIVVAIGVVLGLAMGLQRNKQASEKGHLEVIRLNEQVHHMSDALKLATLDESVKKLEEKKIRKEEKEKAKAKKKSAQKNDKEEKGKVFVLNFKGDMRASAVNHLREEVTAVLSQASSNDEVVVRLESAGGMVHSYGLASSQLDRIRKRQIPLTVCVDKVAASGGYMMACVADKVLSAPFAILGSIGVIAQMPNFNKVLKKHDVDYELLTAGEYKRTLTMFGENTDKGREKFIEDLEETHSLFKQFVAEHRPQVDISEVATGEIWLGTRAKEVGLVDDLQTSDEYLVSRMDEAEVFEVNYVHKKKIYEKLGIAAEERADSLLVRWFDRLVHNPNRMM